MLMRELSEVFLELEKTASRNVMTERLAQLLAETSEDEALMVGYLSLGRISPLYERVDFNLAEKMVMRALGEAFGMQATEVRGEYKKLGDLGSVVENIKYQKSNIKNTNEKSELTVSEVFLRLEEIARENGQGSQERKVEGLAELLVEADGLSAKFIVRIVLGKLRLGFSDKTILDALSVMETGSKAGREKLEEAYQVYPNVGELARLVKQDGIGKVRERVRVTLGVPVMPALCQRLRSAKEMVEKMGEVLVEPKYDGTRVQIHFAKQNESINNKQLTIDNGKDFLLKTFTRNLDETTEMFPELEKMGEWVKAEAVILDSEAVGVHPQTGKMLPFQATITRKRKHGIEEASRQVPLKFFVFDLLYLDGRELLSLPLVERRRMLEEIVRDNEVLVVDPVIRTEKAEEIRQFHKEQLGMGLEGAVIKQVESAYVPGRRGWNWVKFKEVEEANGKLSDTIDGVVMGFYRGRGKRAKFGIGAFLIGVRDEMSQVFKTIAKVGTGLSDEQWQEMRKKLEKVVSVEKPKGYVVEKNLEPDVWVDPEVVVEVAADEITKSPIHSAGKALRFPRLVRFREDKDAGQVTTVEELERIEG